MTIYDLLEGYSISDALTSGDYFSCVSCPESACSSGDCGGCPIFEETKEYIEDTSPL